MSWLSLILGVGFLIWGLGVPSRHNDWPTSVTASFTTAYLFVAGLYFWEAFS